VEADLNIIIVSCILQLNMLICHLFRRILKKHLVDGVNFASGGSGCLAETSRGFVSGNISIN